MATMKTKKLSKLAGAIACASFLLSVTSAHADTLSNLTARYKLDDNAANTTVANDLGSNNAAASTNTSNLSAPGNAGGTGFLFTSASSQYVTLAASAFGSYPTGGSSNTYDLTFSVWFKASSRSTANPILGMDNNVAPSSSPSGYVPAIYIGVDHKIHVSMFWHNNTGNQIVTSSSYDDGNWHLVTDTYSSGVEKLYIDGSFVGSQTTSEVGYSSTYKYFLAAAYASTAWPSTGPIGGSWLYFDGTMDDARIYGRALSSSDIAELYASGTSASPVAPVLSSIVATTTPTSAAITWTTDQNASSTVNYGATSSYGNASTTNTLVIAHQILLSGLSPSTTYHYQAASGNASGLAGTSSDYTFTTLSVDTTPPVISAVASTTSFTSAIVSWNTDETADSEVLYGSVPGIYIASSSSASFATSHSQNLAGLSASTQYYFVVISTDSSGNTATSSEQTFMTVGAVRTLTMYKYEHAGQGVVTATVNGSQVINCGSACSAQVPVGATITFTATPAATSSLSRFEDCPGATSTTCTIVMPNWDMSMGAVFTSPDFTPMSTLSDIVSYADSHGGLTWAFTGDSFTTLNTYSAYFESYFQLHYPNLHFHFRNMARSGSAIGDLTDDPTVNPHRDPVTGNQVNFNLDSRFDSAVYSLHPDVVSVDFSDNGFPTPQKLHDDIVNYITQYVLPNHSTPVILGAWPQNAMSAVTEGSLPEAWSDADDQAGLDTGSLTGTIWHEMAPMMKDNLSSTTPVNLSGLENNTDVEHINEAGTLAAASYALAKLGADGNVSSVAIDAGTGSLVSESDATTTSVIKNGYSGVDFTRLDARLPMAFDDISRPILQIDSTQPAGNGVLDMNKYMLTVNDLHPGTYDVYIDGVNSATVDSGTLASGWNMTTMTQGPIHDQLVEVLGRIRDKEGVTRTRLFQSAQLSDPNNPCVPAGYNWWGDTNYGSESTWYDDPGQRGDVLSANLDSARTELACLDDLIHAAAQPVPHTFSIRANGDVIAPTISNMTASTTVSSATVAWTTDELASSAISLGTVTGIYTTSTSSAALSVSNSFSLSGLDASTTYYYVVTSTDPSGNTATSSEQTFTTMAVPDTTAPVIASIAASTTYSSAIITWTTDEAASSAVNYGASSSYGSASSSSVMSASHSIAFASLNSSTTYHFQIISTDAAGNTGTSTDLLFVTSAAPDITAPVISRVTSSSTYQMASVSWNTDEISDSLLSYGTASGVYAISTSSPSLVTTHSFDLAGLAASTTYYYVVASTDASGNMATSSEQMLITSAAPDVTPPVISAASATTTDTTATITWITDEFSSSALNYGQTASYGAVSSAGGMTTSHSVTLTGLIASAAYHFQVISTDASDNTATSSDLTFTTMAVPDTTAPVISAIASSASEISVTITWNTDEAASSTVEYGADSSYGSSSSSDGLTMSHMITLTDLTPGTLYHFRVSSAGASGNLATSSDLTFSTVALAPQAITSIAASTTSGTATISWMTNGNNAPVAETHSITLTDLNPATTYHFSIGYDSGAGATATSTVVTFTTAQ